MPIKLLDAEIFFWTIDNFELFEALDGKSEDQHGCLDSSGSPKDKNDPIIHEKQKLKKSYIQIYAGKYFFSFLTL